MNWGLASRVYRFALGLSAPLSTTSAACDPVRVRKRRSDHRYKQTRCNLETARKDPDKQQLVLYVVVRQGKEKISLSLGSVNWKNVRRGSLFCIFGFGTFLLYHLYQWILKVLNTDKKDFVPVSKPSVTFSDAKTQKGRSHIVRRPDDVFQLENNTFSTGLYQPNIHKLSQVPKPSSLQYSLPTPTSVSLNESPPSEIKEIKLKRRPQSLQLGDLENSDNASYLTSPPRSPPTLTVEEIENWSFEEDEESIDDVTQMTWPRLVADIPSALLESGLGESVRHSFSQGTLGSGYSSPAVSPTFSEASFLEHQRHWSYSSSDEDEDEGEDSELSSSQTPAQVKRSDADDGSLPLKSHLKNLDQLESALEVVGTEIRDLELALARQSMKRSESEVHTTLIELGIQESRGLISGFNWLAPGRRWTKSMTEASSRDVATLEEPDYEYDEEIGIIFDSTSDDIWKSSSSSLPQLKKE